MKKSKPGKRSCHLVNKSAEWLRDGCWFYPWKRITRMVIGVLAKVVILTLAMQRCCNEFSGVLSVVAALFHRLLVSFISGLMGGHPVSNDQNPPTVRSSNSNR